MISLICQVIFNKLLKIQNNSRLNHRHISKDIYWKITLQILDKLNFPLKI